MKNCRIRSSAIRHVQLFLILLVASIECLGQTGWEWVNRLPVSNNLNSVTYGNGNFVAVGDTGVILKSPDGTDWTVANKNLQRKCDSCAKSDLYDVVYAKNRFIAVGGRIVSSTDVDNWVIVDSLNDELSRPVALTSIACNDSVFVAVGTGGLIMISTDGISWSKVADCDSAWHDNADFPRLYSITYGNGQFVATGALGWDAGLLLTSRDGREWTASEDTSADNVLQPITFGNGSYLAAGSGAVVHTSQTGSDWTSGPTLRSDMYSITSINYLNGKFFIVGPEAIERSYFQIFSSVDGISWTADTGGVRNDLSDISYGEGRYVAVGKGGEIETSSDGKTWVPVIESKYSIVNNTDLFSITDGNGIYLARGADSLLLSSPDGRIWSKQTAGIRYVVDKPVYGNNQFVALAVARAESTSANDWKPIIATSQDAAIWSQEPLAADIWNFNIMGYADSKIAFGNGKFIVFSCSESDTTPYLTRNRNYSTYYSSDGKTWIKGDYHLHTTGWMPQLSTLTYCNNLFFALGDSGLVLTSPDGIYWSDHSVNIADALLSVAYGNGVYVISGRNKTFLVSHDGATWEMVAREDGSNEGMQSLAYGNNQFIAISQNMYYSTDGKNWTEHKLDISYSLYPLTSIHYFDGKFFIVGKTGLILGSSDGNDWTLYHLFDKNEQTSAMIQSQHAKNVFKNVEIKNHEKISVKISNRTIITRLPQSCSTGKYSVKLFDMLGKQVFSTAGSALQETEMFAIPATLSGTYLIIIQGEGGSVRLSSRIVVTR